MKLSGVRKFLLAVAVLAILILGACTVGWDWRVGLPLYYNEMAYKPLAFSPVTATAAGYHVHKEGEGENATETDLDVLLDDYSSGAIQEQISFYKDFDARFHGEGTSTPRDTPLLSGDLWIDFGVSENRVKRALFRLEKEQPFARDPNFYIELLGRALFTPITLEYAPENERYEDIISRLQKVPDLIGQAKQNLTGASELATEAAKDETQGLVNLIQAVIPQTLPGGLQGDYDSAAEGAVAALRDYSSFLDGLATSADWRMGAGLFEEKVRVNTAVDASLDQVLSEAQAEFDTTYSQVIEAAKPIHRKIYGGARAPSDYALMRDILDVVSDDNRLRSGDGLLDRVREDIESAKKFNLEEEVVPVPQGVELMTTDTPPFLRTKYPMSTFQGPPFLDPSEGAQYWVTPIPASWSRGQVRAKLMEFNNFKLDILAVDAFARYAQAAFSSSIENPASRLVRNVDGNQGYTRGWVWYVTDSSMDLGFPNTDEFKLTWFKYKLEFLASTILDIQLHMKNMDLEEARRMLDRQVFMESGANSSALRGIQLRPTEFAMTYIGGKEWHRVREFYQEQTTDFSLTSFHTKALSAGPMPAKELAYSSTEGGILE